MSLFHWGKRGGADLLRGSAAVHGIGDELIAQVALEMFRAGVEPDEDDAGRLERTRWLEEHHAERTFPCGVVPDPLGPATEAPTPVPPEPQPLTPLRPMQVIAAVLPDDLVFIREQGSTEEVEEVGRLPRSAIEGVEVVDAQGAGVPEPVREEIEPSHPVFAVLRWSNAGAPDEDRFLFRSPWMAWQAAHRLREAKRAA